MIRAIPQPIEIMQGGGVALACGSDGHLHAEQPHGLFAGDTRVLSTYRLAIAGHALTLLSRVRVGPSTMQWDLENPRVRTPVGQLPEGTVHVRLRRRVDRALHDCLTVRKFGRGRAQVRMMLQLDADFADLFEVRARSFRARLDVRRVITDDGLLLRYHRRDFTRGLRVRLSPAGTAVAHVGAQLVFELTLDGGAAWSCCIEAAPIIGDQVLEFAGDAHGAPDVPPLIDARPAIEADALLAAPLARGRTDLERLAMSAGGHGRFVAAGAPWFMALFGRDSLITALMTGLLGWRAAEGALDALAALQADRRDDFRDAEPGKLPHELRHGELAHFHDQPHSPYYGAHDVPALFVLTLWHAFRWSGDRTLLARLLPAARRAMAWCEGPGDRDGDGLLEYATRSPRGYYNQSWKDAGDAIVHADGTLAGLPLATVELQGYLFAARLAFAELLDAVGESDEAGRHRAAAAALRARVEDRYWMEEAGCYALALDGDKRMVRSIASNPGHLLWAGLPSRARAARTGRRLALADMSNGHGLRTLSADHPAYNPMSYQLGSVWPHDTALVAAGLFRYGERAQGARLVRGLLDAASAFEDQRLPELFCGFGGGPGDPPTPYVQANCPQAWAAAAPILAAQLFLGLVPDAPRGRCHLDPWLPDWLPGLAVHDLRVGGGGLDVVLRRAGEETVVEHLDARGIEAVRRAPEAPLWGLPPGLD
jgi:glycogen debranching enzyme